MGSREIKLRALALPIMLLASACAGSGDANKLAVWTRSLAATQTDGPDLLFFKRGNRTLAFIGVEHDSNPASSTHRLIESTFDVFTPRVVIVEGVPTSWGYDPARLTKVANEKPDAEGLMPSGETFPAVRGALATRSKLLGGEPSDTDVRRVANSLGVIDQDLLGFYVLRVVPQWVSQRKFGDLRGVAASVLIDQQLVRSRKELGLDAKVLQDAEAWRRWRLSINAGANPTAIDVEEAGPLADGAWSTSKVAASISRARDTHLYLLTKTQLAEHGSVTVVYGGSHALIQYPALSALMGKPCYRGNNAGEILRSCRS